MEDFFFTRNEKINEIEVLTYHEKLFKDPLLWSILFHEFFIHDLYNAHGVPCLIKSDGQVELWVPFGQHN